MAKEKASEQAKAEAGEAAATEVAATEASAGTVSAAADTTPADTTQAVPAWWLCRINDSTPREFTVLAVDEFEAVEKFKRAASILATIHEISAWKLPEDFQPTEQDLALEKRLSAAD